MKKAKRAVLQCEGSSAVAGMTRTTGNVRDGRERASKNRMINRSARARGLPRFRARNSTMPENKEPPVRTAEAFFLAFIQF